MKSIVDRKTSQLYRYALLLVIIEIHTGMESRIGTEVIILNIILLLLLRNWMS